MVVLAVDQFGLANRWIKYTNPKTNYDVSSVD
jgi:hypothetical protein